VHKENLTTVSANGPKKVENYQCKWIRRRLSVRVEQNPVEVVIER
jgi:hypothetical protein